jgi:hypothetical protein
MRAELRTQAKKTRFIGENVIQSPETIEMLFYFLARMPGYRDRKKDVAVVPTVNLD